MAQIFISHSSVDNHAALALRNWLSEQGWAPEDIFIDLHGIGAGERWRESLRLANERCEAVIFLASPESLASTECQLEIRTAEDLGKHIIPLIIRDLEMEDPRLAYFTDRQIVSLIQKPRTVELTADHDGEVQTIKLNAETLQKLKERLTTLGLSSDYFVWNPAEALDDASPYPGLESFSEDDAGIFFGRGGDIARGLAEVRKRRRLGQSSMVVIQAASGAGKSSFLKAGLWPRLKRDYEFEPLCVLRPATGAVTGRQGLGVGLSKWFSRLGESVTAGDIHSRLKKDGSTGLIELIQRSADLALRSRLNTDPTAVPPSPVIAIDQAEELFAAQNSEESRLLLDLLGGLLNPQSEQQKVLSSPAIFIASIRADSVGELIKRFASIGLAPPILFPLPPLSRAHYRDVIIRPAEAARRKGLEIRVEDDLVDALVRESQGADALPMMAFCLNHLLSENRIGSRAALTLKQFKAMGGTSGALSQRLDLVREEFGKDGFDASLKSLIIPHLATWDEDANPPAAKRIVTKVDELLADDRANYRTLVDALIRERLLTRSADTVEIAHEAMLRQPPLSDWLEADRDFLSWYQKLAEIKTDFDRNQRGYLVGRELELSRGYVEERASEISPDLITFVEESVTRDEEEREKDRSLELARQKAELQAAEAKAEVAQSREEGQRRLIRRTRFAAIGATALSIVALLAGAFALSSSREAANNFTKALQATDKLAVELASEIDGNLDVPSQERLFFIEKIEENFATLIEGVSSDDALRLRYASLLVSAFDVASGAGRWESAESYAQEALKAVRSDALLAKKSSAAPEDLILAARVELAMSKALQNRLQSNEAQRVHQRAEDLISAALNRLERNNQDTLLADVIRAEIATTGITIKRATLQNTYVLENAPELEQQIKRLISVAAAREDLTSQRNLYELLIDVKSTEWGSKNSVDALPTPGELDAFEALLVEAEPIFMSGSSVRWSDLYARTQLSMAGIESALNRRDKAVQRISTVIETYDSLSLLDPENVTWKLNLAAALLRRVGLRSEIEQKSAVDRDLQSARQLILETLKVVSIDDVTLSRLFDAHWYEVQIKQERGADDETESGFANLRALIDLRRALSDDGAAAFDNEFLINWYHVKTLRNLDKSDEAIAKLTEMAERNQSRDDPGGALRARYRARFVACTLVDTLDSRDEGRATTEQVQTCLDLLKQRQTLDGADERYLTLFYTRRLASKLIDAGESDGALSAMIETMALIDTNAGSHKAAINIFNTALDLAKDGVQLASNTGTSSALESLIDPVVNLAENLRDDARPDGDAYTKISGLIDSLTGIDVALSAGNADSGVDELIASLAKLSANLRARDTELAAIENIEAEQKAQSSIIRPGVLDALQIGANDRASRLSKSAGHASQREMLYGNWRTLTGAERDDVFEQITQLTDYDGRLTPETLLRVRSHPLSFFAGGELIEGEYAGWLGDIPRFAFIRTPSGLTELRGTNDVFYGLNAITGIGTRTPETVKDYLRAFFGYVRGRHGRFVIVETDAHIPWARNATDTDKSAIDNLIEPVEMMPADDPYWAWDGAATILFKDSLFKARIRIATNGYVRLEDEEILVENLNVIQDSIEFTEAGIVETAMLADTRSPLPESGAWASDPEIAEMVWSIHPGFSAAWRTLAGAELVEALQRYNSVPKYEPGFLASRIKQIRVANLPFYENGKLYEAEYTDDEGNDYLMPLLFAGDRTIFLDGSSDVIHQVNRELGITFEDAHSAGLYTRMFSTFIEGEEGTFKIVDSAGDIAWLEGVTNEEIREYEALIKPFQVLPDPEQPDHWIASGTVQYSDALFYANYRLLPTGMVEMSDDFALESALPIIPRRFGDSGIMIDSAYTSKLQSIPAISDFDTIVEDLFQVEETRPYQWSRLAALKILTDLRLSETDAAIDIADLEKWRSSMQVTSASDQALIDEIERVEKMIDTDLDD